MNKKLEHKLRNKLESAEQENKYIEIRKKHENQYIVAVIMFIGTLGPLYLLFFGAQFLFFFFFGPAFGLLMGLLDVNLSWISPLIHGAIWLAAVISVYKKRSVLEYLIQKI
jgi:hypothetical protein